MAEITPSTLDEYPATSTATHTVSENRLNEKHIPPYQEVLQQPNTMKRKLKRNTEDAIWGNMYSMERFISRKIKQEKRTGYTGKKERKKKKWKRT